MSLIAAIIMSTVKEYGDVKDDATFSDILESLPEEKVFELCRILDTEAMAMFAQMSGVEVDELSCGINGENGCDHVIRMIPVTPALVAWQARYANARYVQHLISDHWEFAQQMRDDYLKELEEACTTTPQTSDATTAEKDGTATVSDSTAP